MVFLVPFAMNGVPSQTGMQEIMKTVFNFGNEKNKNQFLETFCVFKKKKKRKSFFLNLNIF